MTPEKHNQLKEILKIAIEVDNNLAKMFIKGQTVSMPAIGGLLEKQSTLVQNLKLSLGYDGKKESPEGDHGDILKV